MRVLFIDDDEDVRLLGRSLLEELPGVEIEEVGGPRDFERALESAGFDVAVTDYRLPWTDGLEILRTLKTRWPDLPVIMFTGSGTEEIAVAAMKAGLDDYVLKSPGRLARLTSAVRSAVEKADLRRQGEQVQEALRHAEERARLLFEKNPHPMWIYDSESLRFLAVNDAAVDHYGYTQDEFLGMTLRDIRPLEDVPALLHALQTALPWMTYTAPWRHFKKDGSLIDVEITSQETLYAGRPARIALAHDVTEQRRAEGALREVHEAYRGLVDNAVVGIFRSTPEGRFLSANATLARLYGHESPEAFMAEVTDIGRQIYVDPERRTEFARVLAERGEVSRFEIETRRSDGGTLWVSVSARAVRGGDGTLRHYEGIVEDITNRKQAEAALRESEQRSRAQFKGLPVPTYAWRWMGNDFVLVDFNDAAKAITDGGIARLLGATARDLYGESDTQILDDLSRCFAEGKTVKREMDYKFRSADKTRRLAVTYGFVPPDIVLVHAEDVTDRRKAEAALLARVRQQALVAELGQKALAGMDLEPLMRVAAADVARTLDVELCGVLELRTDGGALLLRAGVGWREGAVGRATVPAGTLGRETLEMPPFLREHGVVNGLSVMVRGEGQPFGVLGVYTTRRRDFSEDDGHFLEAVANVLAGAILRKGADEVRDQLLDRLVSAQDDERRRVARELHDGLGQSLTSLALGLRAIEEARTMKAVKASARRLRRIAAEAVGEMGRLARGLHPSALDDLGIVPALTRYVQEHARPGGPEVHVDARGLGGSRLPASVEMALYRAAQEALHNAVRHAAAKTIRIALGREGSEVELTVKDDGRGFDFGTLEAAAAAGRVGLVGLRDRAARLGGTVRVESNPGKGTVFRVRLPVGSS